MYKNNKASTIVEAMIVMMIIVTGVVGMYKIYSESMNLTQSVENKIKAIQIANQGIEAFTNIRDTNWLIFPSDYKNCWNSLNYNENCIGDSTNNYVIAHNSSYRIYKDNSNRWILENFTTGNYSDSTYRGNFKVNLDSNGVYTQSGGIDIKPLYTRELKVEYAEDTSIPIGIDEKDEKMKVISIVQWLDQSSTEPHKIEVEKMLSNWKTH